MTNDVTTDHRTPLAELRREAINAACMLVAVLIGAAIVAALL